jgi:hypothetical protein
MTTDSRHEQDLEVGPGRNDPSRTVRWQHLFGSVGNDLPGNGMEGWEGGDIYPPGLEGKPSQGVWRLGKGGGHRAACGHFGEHVRVGRPAGNEANPRVGCRMQQACRPVGGASRRGGERPRGRNETSQVAARRRRGRSHSTRSSGVDTDRRDDGGAHRGARRVERLRPNHRCRTAKPMSGRFVEGRSTQTASKTSKVRVKSRVVELQGPSRIRAVSRPRREAAPEGGHGHWFFGIDGR